MNMTLDTRLKADTYQLGEFDGSLLLLSKNALFPWFILVPETREIEFHKLSAAQQSRTQQQINAVARFIEDHFSADKINIATIGNIVSQLHIHIIGRNKNDACWPGVVWGTSHFEDYEAHTIATLKTQLAGMLKDIFKIIEDET